MIGFTISTKDHGENWVALGDVDEKGDLKNLEVIQALMDVAKGLPYTPKFVTISLSGWEKEEQDLARGIRG